MILMIKIFLILQLMFIEIYIVGKFFISLIPTGHQRSYVLTIRVKADILKDVKFVKGKEIGLFQNLTKQPILY